MRVLLHFAQLLETLVAEDRRPSHQPGAHRGHAGEHRELEAQNKSLELMNVQLKDMDWLKSSFLATVSHEPAHAAYVALSATRRRPPRAWWVCSWFSVPASPSESISE